MGCNAGSLSGQKLQTSPVRPSFSYILTKWFLHVLTKLQIMLPLLTAGFQLRLVEVLGARNSISVDLRYTGSPVVGSAEMCNILVTRGR